jgi:hypothetical protein
MGNIVVTPLDPYDTRPASMAQCVDPTGKLDVLQVSRYWQRQDEESSSLVENLFSRSSSNDECPPKKRVRSVKSNGLEMLDSQGNRVPADPRQSPWYKQYVQDPHIEKPKFQNKFRRRFRLPYLQFLELLAAMAEEAKTEDGDLHFRRWMGKDAVGRLSSPLSLMILGALRYLGRGWTFDDIEESTGIGEETHRQFFHIFIAFGKEVLFPKYVVSPSTAEQAAGHMAEMELAGFAGCVGSTDATHIMIERCREMYRYTNGTANGSKSGMLVGS